MRQVTRTAGRRLAPLLLLLALLPHLSCITEPRSHDGRYRRVPPDYTGSLQTWWSDDRLREEGEYKDGRRNGHVRGFHPDGSLAFEGDFVEGVPTGALEQRYPGGALAIREVLDAGTVQGPRTEYFPSGKVRMVSAIVDGQRDGAEIRYHENGQPAARGRYEHGVPVGRWESFDETGRLTAETWYWTANGASAGYLETGYDAEQRVAVQTRMLLQDGNWLGRVTMWYPGGQQAGLVETVNGVRQGLDVAWDQNGRKRSEGRRVDDLRTGVWTFWDERGFIERSVTYAADKPVEPEASAVAPAPGG